VTSGYSYFRLRLVSSVHSDTHTCITIDPATEEELGTIPEMGVEETKAAIAAAGKAFQTRGKTTTKVSLLCGGGRNTLAEPFVVWM
jgi:hypothetical protein